jgi:hypothetical protein
MNVDLQQVSLRAKRTGQGVLLARLFRIMENDGRRRNHIGEKERQRRLDNNLCFYCSAPDHYRKTCPFINPCPSCGLTHPKDRCPFIRALVSNHLASSECSPVTREIAPWESVVFVVYSGTSRNSQFVSTNGYIRK